MTYCNSVTALFTSRAPASATAPSMPMLLLSRLQYGTVVSKDNNQPGELSHYSLKLRDRAVHFESPRQRHTSLTTEFINR
jgi:hypothetical protein